MSPLADLIAGAAPAPLNAELPATTHALNARVRAGAVQLESAVTSDGELLMFAHIVWWVTRLTVGAAQSACSTSASRSG